MKKIPEMLNIAGAIIYLNDGGEYHREDGPAIIYPGRVHLWWINNVYYSSNKSYQQAAGLTDEEMTILVLKYGNVS